MKEDEYTIYRNIINTTFYSATLFSLHLLISRFCLLSFDCNICFLYWENTKNVHHCRVAQQKQKTKHNQNVKKLSHEQKKVLCKQIDMYYVESKMLSAKVNLCQQYKTTAKCEWRKCAVIHHTRVMNVFVCIYVN